MPRSHELTAAGGNESVFREYIMDVRIVEYGPDVGHDAGDGGDNGTGDGGDADDGGDGRRYRFEAPHHVEVSFDDPELATLYADVYFDVNGFQEAGTGDRGVPPEIIQGGKDTLAAYFLTRPGVNVNWMASFYGVKTAKIERYVDWVRQRAEEIRDGARERGME